MNAFCFKPFKIHLWKQSLKVLIKTATSILMCVKYKNPLKLPLSECLPVAILLFTVLESNHFIAICVVHPEDKMLHDVRVWCLPKNIRSTGIAFYKGINDFYQPLRVVYIPFTPFYGSLRPFTNHLFAKQQHKSAAILIWFWLYHAQDQVIEPYFQ